jgi:hypothetical protein
LKLFSKFYVHIYLFIYLKDHSLIPQTNTTEAYTLLSKMCAQGEEEENNQVGQQVGE